MSGHPVPPLYNDEHKPYAVTHRSYVYFLSSKAARAKFVQDPLHYLNQPSPLSIVPFRVAIIGPPKSGKTSLANRFAKQFGCMRLSAGEAIRAILDKQRHTELANAIQQHLIKGQSVPDELTIQCIQLALMNVQCQLRGYVLDGFPLTRSQVKLMTESNLIPVRVIELKSVHVLFSFFILVYDTLS